MSIKRREPHERLLRPMYAFVNYRSLARSVMNVLSRESPIFPPADMMGGFNGRREGRMANEAATRHCTKGFQ